jgi:hypothetical protein
LGSFVHATGFCATHGNCLNKAWQGTGGKVTENKTKITTASVAGYFDAITDQSRQQDCLALAELMEKALGEPPRMWGTNIVGFGSYHYKYDSGREGDACLVGFASRKKDIAIYLVAEFPRKAELLPHLGKHELGKGCLYIRNLFEIDLAVLETIIVESAAQKQRNLGS